MLINREQVKISNSKNGDLSSDFQILCAHIWELIDHSIDAHLGDDDKKYKIKLEIMKKMGIKRDEVVISDDGIVKFGEKNMNLCNQPLMRSLFEAFIESTSGRIGRDQLVKVIYGRDVYTISQRRRTSDYHNIVKLISRARLLAKAKLDNTELAEWDWFPFDSITEEWVFHRSRILKSL